MNHISPWNLFQFSFKYFTDVLYADYSHVLQFSKWITVECQI